MQKRLCRRPEIFNDETIHYGIRSLCFCCHEMYTFIIIPPRTRSIVPLRQTTLDGKMYKVKKKTNVHKYKHRDTAQTTPPPRTTNTHSMKDFPVPLVSESSTNVCLCVSGRAARYRQKYEPAMKHLMLIVFVYEQINGERAKRMMGAHTQHDPIPEEFISCLQVIRGNN